MAGLSHTPDGPQCSGSPHCSIQRVYQIYFRGDQTLDNGNTEVGLVYRHLLSLAYILFVTTVGKLGEVNVRTYVLVNFMTPSRRTVILRTSVTPCSTMPSLISLLVTLFKAGQQIIPLDVLKVEWGVTEHLRTQNVFICSRLFSCDSFAHCIKRSPDLRFLMLFGYPAILIIVLCTTNGEREEIVSPSFSKWIIKHLGT